MAFAFHHLPVTCLRLLNNKDSHLPIGSHSTIPPQIQYFHSTSMSPPKQAPFHLASSGRGQQPQPLMSHIVRRLASGRSSLTDETMESAERRRMRLEQLIAILEEATAMAIEFNSTILGTSSLTTQLASGTLQRTTQPSTAVDCAQCGEGDPEETEDSSQH
jgi:hypothetical protein